MNATPESPMDWEDRIVDRSLQELHGDRPPDLAAAVERAFAAGATGATEASNSPPHQRARRRADARPRLHRSTRASVALAAATTVLAAISWAWARGSSATVPALRFEVGVVRGELAIAGDRGATLRAGEAAAVALARGDRLDATEREETEIDLGPFGIVRTDPRTSMEIVDMNVSTKNGIVRAGSLALAVVAGGASWHWIGLRGRAEAGEVLRIETPDERTAAQELIAARSANEQLQRDVGALRDQLAAMRAAGDRKVVDTPTATASAGDTAPAPAVATADAHGPTFGDERFADLLASIDWEAMGKAAAELGIPLVDVMKKFENGEDVPMELRLEIQKLNMKLVEQLPKLMSAGLPGTPGNGVYTHPLVVGNQLAGLLAGANLPLDSNQRQIVGTMLRQFAAEAQGIQDNASELDLDRIVAEVAMKDRMYDELAMQLTPQQRAAIYPDGAGAFDGTSLFRSGLVWQSTSMPVNAGTPQAYADAAAQRITENFDLSPENMSRVRAILDEAARGAPADVWAASSPIERLEGMRFLRTGRAMRAAQLQQNWMRRIMREVPLTPAQRDQLRTMRRVLVPVPR